MSLLARLGFASSFQRCWPLPLLGLLLAGCGKEDIRVYTAAKDKPAPVQMADKGSANARPRPQVVWQLPKGWKETGTSQMNVASFSIPGANGQEAQVTITPLAVLAGREAMIVNMWRKQLGLQIAKEEEIAHQLEPVEVGGEKGVLFDLTSEAGEDSKAVRIVTAMVHRPEASWFYKLSGDAALIEAQKPAFIEFLKSIQLKEPSPSDTPVAEETPKPKWQVPSQWKALPASQMQVARFGVPKKGPAEAEVFVSVFPNDTGGMLANVNRWRKQLGLGEVAAPDLDSLVKPLDPANPEAMLVELTNKNKQLVGAIVPRAGSFWFYKLFGDADAVVPEKEAFLAFAKSNP